MGKSLCAALSLLLLCLCARAEDKKSTISAIIESKNAPEQGKRANLERGDIEVRAFLALYNTSLQNDRYTTFDATFGTEYFFWDRFSAGGQVAHYSTRGYTETRVGPAAKYYLFEENRFAPFIGESILFNKTNQGAYYWTSKASFGFKYFMLPSLALASSLNWYHLFGRSASDAYAALNRVSIEMGFAIHL